MDSRSLDEEFSKACELIDERRFSEARAILDNLVSLYPSDKAVRLKLGYLHWETGELTLAIATFRRAVEIDPRSEIASLALFHCLRRAGNELDAFLEVKRFMSLSDSADYRKIIPELHKLRFPDGRPGKKK